jgi:hypothetical protein
MAFLCCLSTITSTYISISGDSQWSMHERPLPAWFPYQTCSKNHQHTITSSTFPFHFNVLYFRTHFTHYINYLAECPTKNHILQFHFTWTEAWDMAAFIANIAIYSSENFKEDNIQIKKLKFQHIIPKDLWIRIQITPKNSTAILAYCCNSHGYRTYW